MQRGTTDRTGPTRREYLTAGGAVVAGTLLAGCSNDGGGAEPPTATATPSGTSSFAVKMAPMGEVTFDSVPEDWVAYSGDYADMAVALGKADGLLGLGSGDRYYTYPYEELPGVDVDEDQIDAYGEVRTKEAFYELDGDVHFYDPQMLVNWFDWDEADLTEIAQQVAPFVANLIFRREDAWHDYRYYDLYGAFEKVAAVFQERARFEAFQALHEEFLADVQARMPPASERPNVLLTYEATDEPSTFSPYRLNDQGTSKKQWRDLGVSDALAGTGIEGLSTTDRGELDYETLLKVDPDVLLVRGHERKTPAEFRDVVLAYMKDHPVGSELTAVQNGRVYRGGYLYQGPIHNLFLTERAAQQLYPEEFGEVTGDRELFDRERVANIVNGDF